MAAISLKEVDKVYHGRNPVEALRGIDLEIADGEFAALLGPSGCGKSTLLNLLAGFEAHTGGTLTVYGDPVSKPGPDRGVVFQEAALFPWLSVWQKLKKTVLFVTHDIDEAILLANTIYVMSPRPGRIHSRYKVDMERPRSLDTLTDARFTALKREVMHQIRHDIAGQPEH